MTCTSTIGMLRHAARTLLRALVLLVVGRLVLPATALAAIEPVEAGCCADCACDAGLQPSSDAPSSTHSPRDGRCPDDDPHGCLPGCADCACCPAAPVAVLATSELSQIASHCSAPDGHAARSRPLPQPARVFRPPRAA